MTTIEHASSEAIRRIQSQLEEIRQAFEDDARTPPVEDAITGDKYLILRLGNEKYAWPVVNILEVLQVSRIVPVPNVSSLTLGIINFRGQILPVTSLTATLGIDRSRKTMMSKIVVNKGLEVHTGFLVDGVEGFEDISYDSVQPVTEAPDASQPRLLIGQTYVDGTLVSVLDIKQICQVLNCTGNP